MKKSYKIVYIILSFCFVLVFGVVGTLCFPVVNLSVGGKVKFSAPTLSVTVDASDFLYGTSLWDTMEMPYMMFVTPNELVMDGGDILDDSDGDLVFDSSQATFNTDWLNRL